MSTRIHQRKGGAKLPLLALVLATLLVDACMCSRGGSALGEDSIKGRALQQVLDSSGTGASSGADQNASSGQPAITFGQSCALTGRAKALGIGMRNGILAAFNEANQAGGVKGYQLQLITYDDMYEPEPAAANTRRLVEEDNVYALIGEVGTPTSKTAVPVAEESGTPFLAPFTGAMFLRRPWNKDVVNIRGSYNDETAAMIEYYVKKQKYARISIFYQNDSFGLAGYSGVEQALDGLSLSLYSEGTYERNSADISQGFNSIFADDHEHGDGEVHKHKAPPEAIVMIGTYMQLAMFVNQTKKEYPEVKSFATVSFVGADAFSEALGSPEAREGVIVSQVVPLPTDTSLQLTLNFRKAMADFNPALNPGFVEYEGYMAGRLAVVGLGNVDSQQLQEGNGQDLLDKIYGTGIIDIGDFRLGPYGGNCTQVSTGCQCNQGMREVWLTSMTPEGAYELVPDFIFQFGTCGYEAPKQDVLTFGQSAVLSGPAQAQGVGMRDGILAAFQEVNMAGGVAGFQLKLLSYDDMFDPAVAVLNTKKLIEDNSVFALIGETGTNTTLEVLPMVEEAKIPFIGPTTGSLKTRDPFARHILNVRSSYVDEAIALFSKFAEEGLQRISLFVCPNKQARNFDDLIEKATTLLANFDFQIHSTAISSGTNVSESVVLFRDMYTSTKVGPQAVVLACNAETLVDTVNSASYIFPKIEKFGIVASFLRGEEEFISGVRPEVFRKILIASPVPALHSDLTVNNSLIDAYTNALSAYDVNLEPDPVSLEGYIAGKFAVTVLLGQQPGTLLAPGVSFEESREAFLRTVYDQHNYVISGLQLGSYFDQPCDSQQMLSEYGSDISLYCPCNSGSSNVFYKMPEPEEGNRSLAMMAEPYEPFYYSTCGAEPMEIMSALTTPAQNPKTLSGIIVGVVAFLVLLAALAGIFVYRHIKRTRDAALMSTWKIDYDDLEFDRLLGSGASGKTYHGSYKGADVVIKQMDRNPPPDSLDSNRNSTDSGDKNNNSGSKFRSGSAGSGGMLGGSPRNKRSRTSGLQNEIQMLYKLRHPNIRLFMGAYIGEKKAMSKKWGSRSHMSSSRSMLAQSEGLSMKSASTDDDTISPTLLTPSNDDASIRLFEFEHPRDSIYIVSEYMSRGTLYDVITNPTIQLDYQMQTTFLRDVAKGMDFLHKQNPPVIHVDIKSKNMLLDDRWTVKVGDFGHSLILGSLGLGNRIGTPYWCAPEVLQGSPNSTASDVFSFGILMWEVFARRDVYDGMNESQVIDGIKDGTTRPSIPSNCPSAVQDLMQRCWDQNPIMRPEFGVILFELQDWLNQNPARNMQSHANIHHQRTSQLVNKMLPEHVARALQEGRPVEPEHFDDCTILFSDIVGYTTISSAFAPKEVMSMLDRLYSAFDALTRRHNLFKVETIGDAYMVVGNVPYEQNDHAARVCKMALDMVEVAGTIPVSEIDTSFGCISIRIGINSGPVVASVVGDLNPRYTLFGDTVNVASRMESTSQANMIQLSDSTKRRVEIQDPTLQIQFRGESNVKGKGNMMTYWLRPPGHMLLLNWMSGLMNRPDVTVDDLKNLPKIFIEQAESELELDRVLKMRGYPILKISEDVLLRDETICLQDILSLSPISLNSVETAEHLQLLVKWQRRYSTTDFIFIVEDVLKENEENRLVGLDEIQKVPIALLSRISDREQFDVLLKICNDNNYEVFLGFAESLIQKGELEGLEISHIIQMSTYLGPPCTTESQVEHILSLIINGWEGIPFLESIIENGQGQMVTLALSRKESPASVIDNHEILDSMKSIESTIRSVNSTSSECFLEWQQEIMKTFEIIPDNIRDLLGSEEQLVKLLELGLQRPIISRKHAEESLLRGLDLRQDVVVYNVMSRVIKEYDYGLEEILDHPSTLIRSCTNMKEMRSVLKWNPFADFVPWIARLLKESHDDGAIEFELKEFTKTPTDLLGACSSQKEMCNFILLIRWLKETAEKAEQAEAEAQKNQVSMSDSYLSNGELPKRVELKEYIDWISELICLDSIASIGNILEIPKSLWPEIMSKQTLARLLEIRGAKCMPWIVQIVEERQYRLDDIMMIPTRLLYAFKGKNDLEWALRLADYSQAKHSVLSSGSAEDELIRRTHTNAFVMDSHKSTLDILQNAALQKMLYKREKLEEELKSIEAKIKDEWGTST